MIKITRKLLATLQATSFAIFGVAVLMYLATAANSWLKGYDYWVSTPVNNTLEAIAFALAAVAAVLYLIFDIYKGRYKAAIRAAKRNREIEQRVAQEAKDIDHELGLDKYN